MPEPRCVWEWIVSCSEIPFHCCCSWEALGGFFLILRLWFPGTKLWSWSFAWIVQSGTSWKEGGNESRVSPGNARCPKHFISYPKGAAAPGSYKILCCSVNTEENQVWEWHLCILISFSCILGEMFEPKCGLLAGCGAQTLSCWRLFLGQLLWGCCPP